MKSETEKQTAIINAEAQAETVRIKAEAEAAANKTISESLTPNIIEYNKIQKWDGVLPKVTGNGGTLVNFDTATSNE